MYRKTKIDMYLMNQSCMFTSQLEQMALKLIPYTGQNKTPKRVQYNGIEFLKMEMTEKSRISNAYFFTQGNGSRLGDPIDVMFFHCQGAVGYEELITLYPNDGHDNCIQIMSPTQSLLEDASKSFLERFHNVPVSIYDPTNF